MKRIIIALFSLILVLGSALAQSSSMKVIEYNSQNFPAVTANLFYFDKDGNVLNDLQTSNFAVSDNSIPLTLQSITCNSIPAEKQKSIVMSMDRGLSAGDTSLKYFKIARNILDSMADKLNYSNTQVAVTAFDLWSNLMLDFSSDPEAISAAIRSIKPSNSSSCAIGFNNEPAGAMPISVSGISERSIVFASQGIADFDIDELINLAKANNVKIYILFLGKSISDDFKRVALETGGNYFDNITSKTNIMPIVYSIVRLIEEYVPCQFMWYGNHDCLETHDIVITDKTNTISAKFNFVISETGKPTFLATPPYLEYSSVPISSSLTQDITIQATNSDIVVTKLTIGNPAFQIISGDITSPKIIYKNSTHTLSIRYTPIDSAIIFTKLIIESNACFGKEIFITGGFPNRPPKTKTIELISPVCGETLVIGDTADVRWQGLLPKDVIQLEYSPDSGANWYALAKNTDSLHFSWPIPHSETDGLIIRAIQLWPNNVGRTLDLKHRGAVNSAFFNRVGDRVVTASEDSCAVIWNSNNGDKLHILKHSKGRVNYAVFDPNNKFVLTACTDGSVYMFDSETGSLIREFRHSSEEVLSVELNPAGNRFVSVSKDKSVYLWNTSGSKVKEIDLSSHIPYFATYDNDGYSFLVTAQDGLVSFYDNSGKFLRSFDSKSEGEVTANSRHGAFNYDGSKVSVINDPNHSAIVFNAQTGEKLYSLSHFKDSGSKIFINSTSFFYNPEDNTEYIITSGTDNSVKRWKAADGSIPKGQDGKDTLHIFKEHLKPVASAVFNFDGSRLLTASWDSTAKIWNLNQRDLQMDSTNCLLSIGRAELEPVDIDFGDVLLDDVAILTHGFIRNTKDFKFNIRNIRFFGGDIDDFKVIDDLQFPMIIDANELKTLSIRFQPTAAGIRKVFAEIIIPNDTVIVEIFGNGIDVGLHASAYSVNFGRVEIDEFKDTTMTALLTNNTSTDITIDSIYFEGPDNEHFSMPNMPVTPLLLVSGQSMSADFRFMPEDLGRLNGIVVFDHNGKGTPTKINLFGQGVGVIRDTFQISISPIEGKPGETITLPIKITRTTSNGAFARLEAFNSSLSFNATLLEPIGDFASDMINKSVRTIKFDVPYNQSDAETVFNLTFKVGLGNDTSSVLRLFDSKPIDNSKIIIIENSSTFKLLNICGEGGTRLFDSENGRIQLMQNKPNPFSETSTIDYDIIEKGMTKLTVYDMTGVPIITLLDEWKEPGSYSMILKASDFASGIYYYVLETPTQRFYRTMQVVK